ncbi:hypothetical protein HYG81_01825 [Natrinema zhouii]|uniref:Uncharacterized protein n=1 Tax=Natrinema zhouii TaxID=1710539 RepID=A0A7D6GRZ5_9EURY|nr:hypothetical protein [Natrinema zhouii]QLK26383.1 hypothetical protein HYG81_01825 [Natrinema zhouii]
MSLRSDERAVTVQIGAVLLLAIIFAALALYQVNAVPAENHEVEFNHNQEVQTQLLDVRNTIVSVSGGNSGGSNTVTLGATYPERTFSLNPGPMSGSLRAEPVGELRIQNATVAGDSGELSDVWSDGYETYGLTYTPGYNEYRTAPETVYEHGSLFNSHPNDAVLPVSDQLVIDGSEITLVTLQGNISESGTNPISVDARAFSTSSNTISIENESTNENISITLPTLSPRHWNETLSDAEKVDKSSIVEGTQWVTFELEPGEYSLQMAEVGVGDASRSDSVERAEYIYVGRQDTFVTVEVRDVFNNPVQNTPVEVKVNGEERKKPTTTGSNGQIRLEVDTDDNVTVNVPGTDLNKVVGEGDENESTGENGSTDEHRPTIEQFDVVDQTQQQGSPNYNVAFNVDWTVSDSNNDMGNITIRLRDQTGATVDSEIAGSSTGSSESGTTVLEHECKTNDGTCSGYQIEIEATDEEGLRGFASITADANGSGSYNIDDSNSGQISYVTSYNDGSGGSTDPYYDGTIPPGPEAKGVMDDFGAMLDPERDGPWDAGDSALLKTEYVSDNQYMELGTRTSNVPTTADSYLMQIEYRFYNQNDANPGDFEIVVVDEQGTELQREPITEIVWGGETAQLEFDLNDAAMTSVQENGELNVMYEREGGSYQQMLVYYQRLISSS